MVIDMRHMMFSVTVLLLTADQSSAGRLSHENFTTPIKEDPMAETAFKGTPVPLAGEIPQPGAVAPDFRLVGKDLSDVTLKDYSGKTVVLNVFVRHEVAQLADWQGLHGALTNPGIPLPVP